MRGIPTSLHVLARFFYAKVEHIERAALNHENTSVHRTFAIIRAFSTKHGSRIEDKKQPRNASEQSKGRED